ncbi:MAG: hypothetical protein ASARMPRED_006136 [Alectoria sarmentosa]|nr:MAG: hypothetical protein ASARMPRED_006136 [Alectoria sarmentosa]
MLQARQTQVPGVATFNNFTQQGHTVCSNTPPEGVYGTAVSDIASFITGIKCGAGNGNTGNDMTKCTSSGDPIGGYEGPSCTNVPCGTCYRVTPNGGYNGASVGQGQPVTVMIFDVCPAEHAQNYCKALKPAPANDPKQTCEERGENEFDIDTTAYSTLTGGLTAGSGPNMNILISGPVPCTPA